MFPAIIALIARPVLVAFAAAAVVKEPALLDVMLSMPVTVGGAVKTSVRVMSTPGRSSAWRYKPQPTPSAKLKASRDSAQEVLETLSEKMRASSEKPRGANALTASKTIVIDNKNGSNDLSQGRFDMSSKWLPSDYGGEFYGSGFRFAHGGGTNGEAEFLFQLDTETVVEIDAWWTTGPDRADKVSFVVVDARGRRIAEFDADQTRHGQRWVGLGKAKLPAGWNKVVVSSDVPKEKVVIADALRVRHLGG